MPDNISNNKRIAKNTLFLYIRMFFALLVTLYTSRVVLNTLGVVDYGVYNVVAGFVALFGFLNASLSASMQRFYNFEIGKGNESGVSMVYSTGLIIHAVLSIVILLLLETFGLWYVNHVMVVPAERLQAANILFQVSVLSMLLLVMQIPYLGLIMAYERMGYYAIVTLMDVILKLLIVLALPFIPYDKLIIYSVLYASVSIVDFLCYYIYAKYHFNFVFREKIHVERHLLSEMLSFSGWNLLGSFAHVLKGQGVNLILNSFFGPVVNAARGVAFQIHSAITNFSGSITTAFRPQLVNAYAAENKKRAVNLMFFESKICAMLVLTLAVPMILEIDYILHIWLGNTIPPQTNIFTRLVLIDGLITTLNPACTQLMFATGKIKNYQIASTCVNIMLLPFAWLCLKIYEKAVIVFLATMLFSLMNQIVCVFFVNQQIGFGIKSYVRKVCIPYFKCIVLLPIIPYIVIHLMDSTFIRLVVVCLSSLLASVFLTYIIVFNKYERNIVLNFVKQKLNS